VLRPARTDVCVIVTEARLDRLATYAALARTRRAAGPTLWFVTGRLFDDSRLAALTDGSAQVALLNKAAVDAVCLTPDWLRFGLPRLGRLVSDARFYVLSSNLLDSAGRSLGQSMFVRRIGWNGVAATGAALDSSDIALRADGVRYVSPAFACNKVSALMRQRADFVGVIIEPNASAEGLGVDFGVNSQMFNGFAMPPSEDPGRVFYYGLKFQGTGVNPRSLTVDDLVGIDADSGVVLTLDSLRLVADSLAARAIPSPRVPRTRGRLNDELVRGVLAEKLSDGFLCDSLFVSDFKEPKNVGALVDLLRDPGRLAVLLVPGEVLRSWPTELVLRPGLSRSALSRVKSYRIATTVDYLQRNPRLADLGFELSDRSLWTICLDILESGQAK